MNGPTPRPSRITEALWNSPFLKACRREPSDVTPIWLMRQAGRYMAEYRAVRSQVSFLELCKRPELATEVTVTAAERLGVDAAILFADILLILEPLGFDLEFAKGEGPVIHNPDPVRVRRRSGPPAGRRRTAGLRDPGRPLDPGGPPARHPADRLRGCPVHPGLLCHRGRVVAALRAGQDVHVSGRGGLEYAHGSPGRRDGDLPECPGGGRAQVLQVFDSWVGTLSPDDYRRFVQPHMSGLFARLDPTVPVIHFGTDTGSLLELQRDAGGSVIGLDWRVDLDRAWERLGDGVAVQGNLDPVVLLAPPEEIAVPGPPDPGTGRRTPRPYLQPRPRHHAPDARRPCPRPRRDRSRRTRRIRGPWPIDR